MKKAICLLFLSAAFLMIACGPKNISVDRMNSLVHFNKSDQKKVPITCILILPADMKKMPLYEEDKNFWPWFFTEAFGTVCEHAMVVSHFEEIQPPPQISLIIKPKLQSWTLLEIPQKYQDEILWHCKMKVEFSAYDAHNVMTHSFVIEKEGWRRDRTEAVSDAMDRFIPSLRNELENSALFFFQR